MTAKATEAILLDARCADHDFLQHLGRAARGRLLCRGGERGQRCGQQREGRFPESEHGDSLVFEAERTFYAARRPRKT